MNEQVQLLNWEKVGELIRIIKETIINPKLSESINNIEDKELRKNKIENKEEIKEKIISEICARLHLTAIADYDNIITSISRYIDIDKYLFAA